MEQFNTWKPPAGEAGLCVTSFDGRQYFEYWQGICFGKGHKTADGAWCWREEPGMIQENSGWRWATLSELTAAGISEDEARKMVHKSMLPDAPWYPPQQEGFGPWIEGSEYPAEIENTNVAVLLIEERRDRRYAHQEYRYPSSYHWPLGTIAYCVKLDEKPAPVESGGDDVLVELRRLWSIYGEEAVNRAGLDVGMLAGQRWTMAHLSIAADLLAASKPKADPNAAMLARDEIKPVAKPQPIAAERVPVNPFLVCAPWTNRFGGWGAS